MTVYVMHENFEMKGWLSYRVFASKETMLKEAQKWIEKWYNSFNTHEREYHKIECEFVEGTHHIQSCLVYEYDGKIKIEPLPAWGALYYEVEVEE